GGEVMAVIDRFYGTGRRKTSVARVWVRPGPGRIMVNRRSFEDYFPRETLRMIIAQPLEITNTHGQFHLILTGQGGPRTGSPARACAAPTAGASRSRRPGCSRATRGCASARSTVSPARARSSSTRSGEGMIRVAVAGASGYMGAELLRVLLHHPEVEL